MANLNSMLIEDLCDFIIVLSTLTGTANFADSYVPDGFKLRSQVHRVFWYLCQIMLVTCENAGSRGNPESSFFFRYFPGFPRNHVVTTIYRKMHWEIEDQPPT
eukprot:COSAG02_NODE_526_length_20707_cov_11.431337_4_plen_103_part_00